MPGMTDYMAEAVVNDITGSGPPVALGSRFVGLFTTAPTSDSGTTGAVEASGTNYARVQISGAVTIGASFTTASTSITLAAAAPAWLTALGSNGAGVNVFDFTTGQQIGTVASISGSTVTLTAAALHASAGSSDALQFSAFPPAAASSGSEPAVTASGASNGAAISFPQAGSGGWGTAVAFGIFDAATGGNLIDWDYLGTFPWLPFSCAASVGGNPGVLTAPNNSYGNGDPVVISTKISGSLPTITGGSMTGILTVAGHSGDTFNVGANTLGTGDGLVKKIVEQAIPANVVFTIPASGLSISAA